MTRLPHLLIALRALLGPLAILVAALHLDPWGVALSVLVVVGVLSDVLDGVVARRVGVSTDDLRVWDSRVDVVFFVGLVVAVVVRSPELLVPVGLFFVGMAVLELAVHAISFARFRKQSSTHHYLSKAFSIVLFGLIVQLFLLPEVTWYFWLVAGFGVVSFVEAGLIMLRLNRWQCDVRTLFDVKNGEVVKPAPKPSQTEG